jgi:antitoxin component YwqK of YwqJK toxin-antitoxin module
MKTLIVFLSAMFLVVSVQAQNCRDTIEYFEFKKTPFRKYTICDNRIEGIVVFFGYSGDTVQKALYRNDTIQVAWNYYSKNRLANKEFYKNGRLWNIEKVRNAKIDQVNSGDFKNGTGTIYDYDVNGKLCNVLYLEDGMLEGNFLNFGNGNRLFSVIMYHKDKAITKTFYRHSGKIWRKFRYEEDGINVKTVEYLRWYKWHTYHPKKEQ